MSKSKTIYLEENRKLRSWLTARREESGLTIRQLAEKLDWSPAIVGKIFTGDRRLDVVEYFNICQALDADPCTGIKNSMS